MERTTGCMGTPWWRWDPDAFLTEEPGQDLVRREAALRERQSREGGTEDGTPLFLLEYARRTGEDWAGALAEESLAGRSGDPLGAYARLEAYAQTGRPGCREAAREMLDGALRTGRLPGGGFVRTEGGAAETAWNAQMIAALVKAYRVLGVESYLTAAQEARLFVKTRLTQSNGRLWRRWLERTPQEEGRLEDYGFYCWALLELYEAEFSVSCLREAEYTADRMAEVFRDPRGGIYDFDAEAAIGSGAAALALSKLAVLTGIPRYQDLAREQSVWLAEEGGEALDGLALLGMVESFWPRRGLVCAAAETLPAWLAPVGEEYRLAVLAKTQDNSRGLENAVPSTAEFPVPEFGHRLYLCRDGVWSAPAEDLFQLYRQLSPEGAAVS